MNRGHDYEARVGGDAVGRPLLSWLSERWSHTTGAAWAERIEAGLVLLDGGRSSPDASLRRGQQVTWRRPPWEEPAAPLRFAVLHEDGDVLAVDKPSGLPTLPGAGFLEHTLWALVRRTYPAVAPVHRLGRFTSGIVLFATGAARAHLSRRFAAGAVHKRYRALASGDPASESFAVDAPIGPVPHAALGHVHGASSEGKPSWSEVRVLERRSGAFLCDVAIRTGRPHQIRIHLAAAGHPLVGDPLYGRGGTPIPGCRALPGDPGYRLHAAEVRFAHPRTGAPVAIRSDPPLELSAGQDFQAASSRPRSASSLSTSGR